MQNRTIRSTDVMRSTTEKRKLCDELKDAMDKGGIGDIVAKHEELITQYYGDVQDQAKESFSSAKSVAKIGFGVLIVTVAYALMIDALARFPGLSMTEPSKTVAGIGVISGVLIEFIAGINFWLYARASRQFGAFHICLERTHRYLVAYKISEKLQGRRDETLESLVCIMANAPMITQQETDGIRSKRRQAKGARSKPPFTDLVKS